MVRELTLLDWILLVLAAALLLPVPVVFLGVPGTQGAINDLARRFNAETLWAAFGALPVIGLGCLAVVTVRRWGRFEWALVVLGVTGVLWAVALIHTLAGATGALSGLVLSLGVTSITAAVARRTRSAGGFPVSVPTVRQRIEPPM